ncbi:MAG TPA: hypothetical protein DCZ92_08840 [Elusimicrobia bacterium]|nr:MAG: hypothetical protein A2016_01685 [Elusimicrobia bacterium GWF2_62_30]HBA60911.1 hypothetical protein [Elusimicrobiota bacterium]
MQKERREKFKLIGKFLVSNIGTEDVLAGIPNFALAAAALWLGVALLNDPALEARYAWLRYWALYEMVSVVILQYLVFVFNPDPKEAEATPVWLRVGSIFAVPLFLFGLKASFFMFKKIFIYFWPFIIAKGVTLYLHRPSEKDRTVGCLGAVLGLMVLILLYGAVAALEAGLAWYLLAGFVYFALQGTFEIISEPLYQLPDYDQWNVKS